MDRVVPRVGALSMLRPHAASLLFAACLFRRSPPAALPSVVRRPPVSHYVREGDRLGVGCSVWWLALGASKHAVSYASAPSSCIAFGWAPSAKRRVPRRGLFLRSDLKLAFRVVRFEICSALHVGTHANQQVKTIAQEKPPLGQDMNPTCRVSVFGRTSVVRRGVRPNAMHEGGARITHCIFDSAP